jgi:hypothetical protein
LLIMALGFLSRRARRTKPGGRRREKCARTAARSKSFAIAATLLLSLGALSACGEDEVIGSDTGGRSGSGGSSGSAGSSGSSGSGGGRAGSGGSGASSDGGGSGGGSADSSAGSGGGVTDAQAGSAGTSGGDGSRCRDDDAGYKLAICVRLTEPTAISLHAQLIPGYIGAIRNDCRVSRLFTEHPSISEFANRLTQWSLGLIGCSHPAATTFALADGRTPLTAADVAVLIELYVRVATLRFSLSPAEIAALREVLECLGAAAVTLRDAGAGVHALSSCVPEAGTDASSSDGASAGSTADAAADASAGASGESDAGGE